MADTYDQKDFYTPEEWVEEYPRLENKRFAYLKYTYLQTIDYWRDNPPHTDKVGKTRSYVIDIPYGSLFINKAYELYETVGIGTDTKSVLVAEGTILEADGFPTVSRGYEYESDRQLFRKDHKITSVTIIDSGWAKYSFSTSADGRTPRGILNATDLDDGTIVLANRDGFRVEYDEENKICKISGQCQIIKNPEHVYVGDTPELLKHCGLYQDTKDELEPKPNPYHETNYTIELLIYANYEEAVQGVPKKRENPQVFDALIPTDEAWVRNKDKTLTKVGKLPQKLGWARPYPYGKWYRGSDGQLKTRGLPNILIDTQGAFNECPNLIYVKIPESVKSIGRYAFRDTNLKSVVIASDCNYYPTSFPLGCKIHFYGGGSPIMTDIRSLESYMVGELETKTIYEMEGS